ncbi:class I SAM-dependent methyltransferase [Nannocystis sp. SCPEA4]|uniref:class I SAM-dependent methyltransferase n=1 Tax=Nannocystis sp. SCPEA4 TaxID=2996787 RepID=UPI002271284E|nr:class I SAM-dependent methyltransferase [Nannocystis sp. SCPEA4]
MTRRGKGPLDPEALLRLGTSEHYEDPELYDFEYRDHRHDVAWYRGLARDRGPRQRIVELGAGTGRISLPLCHDGHSVVAVDRMPTMLDHLRSKAGGLAGDVAARLEPVLGDIMALPLPDASADLVFAPFNVLMHLYSWADLLRCFREAARVLVPGGRFAFDVLLPDLEWLTWDPDERHSVTHFTHPRTGAAMVYSTNHTYDPHTQVCHVRIFYDEAPRRPRAFKPPPEPLQVVHLAHRQIFPEELRHLVAAAGLALDSLGGNFRGTRLATGIDSQCGLCTKPEGHVLKDMS